jgi:hypothetical protein
MPQYGYQAPRMAFDSTIQIPTFCGVPTLKSVQFVNKKGAIAFDSCNNRFYTYNPKTLSWSQVSGGGSTDTTSLSSRINLKLDSLKRRTDSVFAYRNGNQIFQYKDSVGTNPPPNGYYGAFQDNTTQTALDVNVATPVNFNTTDLSNGVSIVNDGNGNPTRVTIANAGVYNIQFSLQLEKISGSGNYVIDIWLRKNGTNVEGTTGKLVLTGSANASPVVAAWNYVLQLASNDYVELMWSTSNTNAVIISESASTPYSSVPSSILTITQQSGIMAGTGISPLDTANMLSPYQRKFLPANSIQGNNTSAAANAQSIFFKDTSGVYSGTITWTGTTAPSGTTSHTYRWTRIGSLVLLNISIVFQTAGSGLTAFQVPLPSDAPTPVEPSGLSAASNPIFASNITTFQTLTGGILGNAPRSFLRNNAGNNGFEILGNFTGSSVIGAVINVQYNAQ